MRLKVCLGLLILLLGAMILQTNAAAADITASYVDNTGDVYDNNQGIYTSEKPEYDIINASMSVSEDTIDLVLDLKGSLDMDGYYIFQGTADNTPGYYFYFNKAKSYGNRPNEEKIPVTGTTQGSRLTLTIKKADLAEWNTLEINNASAQSSDLRFIDVLECQVELPQTDTINEMNVYVHSEKDVFIDFRSTYKDSRAFKSHLDDNFNGYVEAYEIDNFEYNWEASLRKLISNNKNDYYSSSISLENKNPWDIYTFVKVVIPVSDVTIEDESYILYQFQLKYKDVPTGRFKFTIPMNTEMLNQDFEDYTLTIQLADGLEIDKTDSDMELVPYVYTNKTGLTMNGQEIEALPDDFYSLTVVRDGPKRDEKALYLLIAMVSIVIGIVLFYFFQKYRKKRERDLLEKQKEEKNEKKRSNRKERGRKKEQKRRGR